MIILTYPDWVLKHKKKGTYINKVGNNYYLYAAHSEHIPGTANKSRRICDGYLGRITETDGFIPKKPKPSPTVLEYGLSCAIVSLCKQPFQRIANDHPDIFKDIIIRSILLFIYDQNASRLQHLSYITSFMNTHFIPDEQTEFLILRTSRMIKSILSKKFPDPQELSCFLTEMTNIKILKFNKDWVISKIEENTDQFLTSLHIDFKEDTLWQSLLK